MSHLEDLVTAECPLVRPPHLNETSLPGVFAVGDVRGGNVKRVASAVGEGSIAVSFVHPVLHEQLRWFESTTPRFMMMSTDLLMPVSFVMLSWARAFCRRSETGTPLANPLIS